MSRLLIVANRLPVTVERRRGEHRFHRSVGGVATGLDSYRRSSETLWIGWAEMPVSRLDAEERARLTEELREQQGCEPVFLTDDDVAGFYHGFSNRTLWPLLHYFARFAEFRPDFWRAYERVNRKYRDAVLKVYQPGDRIWVHDYQLMLLPQLLREKLPDAPIGFFLHIPFPNFEMYRLLPWRRELLEGVLGANLVGFHTHDYVQHFLGSVRSLLGIDDRMGQLRVGGRIVLVDAFPMGIDFARYSQGATSYAARRERDRLISDDCRIVLSIDRLDYTKGIPERLRAFDAFLEQHPEWRGRVKLLCIAVPSRSRVWRYRELKREVDELVGDINGRWGSIEWTPVRYLYRSLPFNTLLGVYAASDVALVTPLRDGMNLIAKEYVAVHAEKPGVLVLSEMAGAASELADAIVVNPHDTQGTVDAIAEALEMPVDEQVRRNRIMCRRLKRYDVNAWAQDFLGKLDETMMQQLAFDEYELNQEARGRLVRAYEEAGERLLVLDYDGTLVPFADTPGQARPDEKLKRLLGKLAEEPANTVVILSGRDRHTLERWLGDLPVALVAEHGAWVREQGEDWVTSVPVATEWKQQVSSVLERFVDRTPGSFIEEKDFALVWHYRGVGRGLADRRLGELTEPLAGLAKGFGLVLLPGNHVLEVKNVGVDKGSAAHRWMGRPGVDFILTMGDDTTDEDMFEAAPSNAWTIKVGGGTSRANFALKGTAEAVRLLTDLSEVETRALVGATSG